MSLVIGPMKAGVNGCDLQEPERSLAHGFCIASALPNPDDASPSAELSLSLMLDQ